MKHKIGVITLYDLNNYGNRLQNCAVIKCLEVFGVQAETILIERHDVMRPLKDEIKAILGRRHETKFYKFFEFSRQYTNPKWFYCPQKVINTRVKKRYQAFAIGSDQVWNSKYLKVRDKDLILQERLLGFAKPNQRISIAASFSLQDIPDDDKRIFFDELKLFPKILVREKQGKKIVQSLGEQYGKKLDSVVVLDPTLLLTREYWDGLKSNVFPEKDYILEIFICPKSKLAVSVCDKIQEQYHCKKINILDTNSGPREFIELVSKARYICTDSFHAMAFSILFQKQFIIFERSDKSQKNDSRFVTIFDTLKMNNRIATDRKEVELIIKEKIDYEQVTSELENARKSSWEILEEAFRKLDFGECNE